MFLSNVSLDQIDEVLQGKRAHARMYEGSIWRYRCPIKLLMKNETLKGNLDFGFAKLVTGAQTRKTPKSLKLDPLGPEMWHDS